MKTKMVSVRFSLVIAAVAVIILALLFNLITLSQNNRFRDALATYKVETENPGNLLNLRRSHDKLLESVQGAKANTVGASWWNPISWFGSSSNNTVGSMDSCPEGSYPYNNLNPGSSGDAIVCQSFFTGEIFVHVPGFTDPTPTNNSGGTTVPASGAQDCWSQGGEWVLATQTCRLNTTTTVPASGAQDCWSQGGEWVLATQTCRLNTANVGGGSGVANIYSDFDYYWNTNWGFHDLGTPTCTNVVGMGGAAYCTGDSEQN